MDVRRVISQVQEQRDTLHTAIFLEIAGKESSSLLVDTHGRENDGEVVLVAVVDILLNQASLTADLRGNLIVRQTSRRENGNLLATSDRVHRVDRRDTGRDHFLWVHLFDDLISRSWKGDTSYLTREYGLIGLPLISR